MIVYFSPSVAVDSISLAKSERIFMICRIFVMLFIADEF